MDKVRYNWLSMSYKRALLVGCSHGLHADPVAIRAILAFKKDYKPHTVVHLGDYADTTAFRSGAKGTKDENEPIDPDIDEGLRFLDALGVTIALDGNHEARIWRARSSPNPFVSYAACKVADIVTGFMRKRRIDHAMYDGVWQHRMLGNFRVMHGTFYNENATRDHAEKFGNVIHAHTHRCAHAKGRRSDNPTGFCVGTLTRASNMDYANTKASTLAWSQGFVWGEYSESRGVFWLHEHPATETEWRLP